MADDVQAALKKEQERLAKLWASYEAQEKEMQALKTKVAEQQREMEIRDRKLASLKTMLGDQDKSHREMEIEATALRQDKLDWDPKIRDLQAQLRIEKDRFAKLFKLAEELEEEVQQAKQEIAVRDEWFRLHAEPLRNIEKAIEEWDQRIESVTVRKSVPGFDAALKKLGAEPKV